MGRLASWYVALAARHGVAVCVTCIGLAAFGAAGAATRLQIDPRVEALLPADTPSSRALDRFRQVEARGAPLYLVVASPEPTVNRRITRHLAARLRAWPETRAVMRRRDPSVFLDHRLLYVPADELASLADRVERISEWHECEAFPGCVNLDDRPEVPTEEELLDLVWERSDRADLIELLGGGARVARVEQDSRGPGLELGELCNSTATVCVVEADMRGDVSDTDYATRIDARAEALIEETRASLEVGPVRVATSGRYRNAPRIRRAVATDVRAASALSTTLVLLVLLLHFRGPRSLLLLALPIVVAAGWTAGVIALISPRLNLMSALVLVVLTGLGIDYGVHLLSHYGAARSGGLEPAAAVERTMTELLPSTIAAATSTVVVFVALGLARFEGLRQLGPLAALGIALAFLATVTLFPPLVLLAHRLRPETGVPTRRWPRWSLPAVGRPLRLVVIGAGLLVAVLGSALGLPALEIERDMSRLRPADIGHGIDWGSAMHGTTRTAFYLLADDAETLERTAADLRRRALAEPGRLPGLQLITLRSFLPADQPARLDQIARLRSAVERARARAGDAQRSAFERVELLLATREPLTLDELPGWVKVWFTGSDGEPLHVGVAFVSLRAPDVADMEQLATELAQLRERYPEVELASSAALLGDAAMVLKRDGPLLLGAAILGAFLTALALGRSPRRALQVLLPLVVGGGWIVGLMVLLSMRINFYNLLVFPLAFGVGVDGAVYLVWAGRDGRAPRSSELRMRSRAILVSGLTTIAALGSLAVSTNPGIRSIAWAVTLTFTTLLATLLMWFPLWLSSTSSRTVDR